LLFYSKTSGFYKSTGTSKFTRAAKLILISKDSRFSISDELMMSTFGHAPAIQKPQPVNTNAHDKSVGLMQKIYQTL